MTRIHLYRFIHFDDEILQIVLSFCVFRSPVTSLLLNDHLSTLVITTTSFSGPRSVLTTERISFSPLSGPPSFLLLMTGVWSQIPSHPDVTSGY